MENFNNLLILLALANAAYGAFAGYALYRSRDRRPLNGALAGGFLSALGSIVIMALIGLPAPDSAPPYLLGLSGLVGGILALVPLFLLARKEGKKCPYCYSINDVNAVACAYCGHDFPNAPTAWTPEKPLLSIRDLVIEYKVRQGSLVAVDKLDLNLKQGEVMALVGESGCGKSTLAYGIIRHVTYPGEITGGRMLFQGKDILELNTEGLREFRWRNIAVIFQAAQNALNPVMRIGDQFIETVKAHEPEITHEQITHHAVELLDMVGLEPKRVMESYPFQLSGGMRQRVIIALSLVLDPKLLILDEPTTALDVVTQIHILDILRDIREKLGLTMLLSTHDISIVARVADRVAVMYAGKIAEVGTVNEIFYRPYHPYTSGLVKAAPSLIGDLSNREPIPGVPPNFLNMPTGCRFHPRCPYQIDICVDRVPEIETLPDGRKVACHRWQDIHEQLQTRIEKEEIIA
jgi:peptide/nickel transport system ATP-binding protein